MNKEEFQQRRRRLLEAMEGNSLAIVFSGVAKIKSEDENFPFEADRSFFYLTGIDQEDCALLLIKSEGESKEFLFIPPFDPVKEKWYGKKLRPEEATAISGIRNVLFISALQGRVDAELSGSFADFGAIDKCYLNLDPEKKIAETTSTRDLAEQLKARHLGLDVLPLSPLTSALRRKKSEAEIAEFKKAIESTRLGIMAAMAIAGPEKKEYELAHRFYQASNDDNADQGLAFSMIVASGKNCCVLHYPNPLGTIKDGDLVLMDVGAKWNGYCADISRTFPANGRFSPKQKEIYQIVLGANKMVASTAKPGISIPQLQEMTKNYLANECVAHGLLEKPEDIGNVYFHGVSHFIGLDTHDVGDRKTPLQEGDVISDEPGLYFSDLGIGVRIEDDLLITANGAVCLSQDIMKEVADIERFFSGGKKLEQH